MDKVRLGAGNSKAKTCCFVEWPDRLFVGDPSVDVVPWLRPSWPLVWLNVDVDVVQGGAAQESVQAFTVDHDSDEDADLEQDVPRAVTISVGWRTETETLAEGLKIDLSNAVAKAFESGACS